MIHVHDPYVRKDIRRLLRGLQERSGLLVIPSSLYLKAKKIQTVMKAWSTGYYADIDKCMYQGDVVAVKSMRCPNVDGADGGKARKVSHSLFYV